MNPIRFGSSDIVFNENISHDPQSLAISQLHAKDSLSADGKQNSCMHLMRLIILPFKKAWEFICFLFERICCLESKKEQKVIINDKKPELTIVYSGNPLIDFIENRQKIIEICLKYPKVILENFVEEFLQRPKELFSSLRKLREQGESNRKLTDEELKKRGLFNDDGKFTGTIDINEDDPLKLFSDNAFEHNLRALNQIKELGIINHFEEIIHCLGKKGRLNYRLVMQFYCFSDINPNIKDVIEIIKDLNRKLLNNPQKVQEAKKEYQSIIGKSKAELWQ